MGRTTSVRFRITALATVIVAVVLTVVAVAVVVTQDRALTAAVDDGLRRRADDLVAAAQDAIPATLAGVDDETASQIVSADGEVLVASPNIQDDGPIGVVPDRTGERISVVTLVGLDDSFRVLSQSAISVEGPVVIHVATAAEEVSDSVAILRSSLLVAIPLSVALVAAIVWWVVGRALRPIEEMRTQVDSITDSDLSKRVPVPDTDDEVGRLAVTMNRMLSRVEEGVIRLQRFVADASHELRSPLTRIRGEVEVDLANQEGADLVRTHESVLVEAVGMEQLVADLLFLARSDAGHQAVRAETVDLDDLVLGAATSIRSAYGVEIDLSGVSGGQVTGDPAQLSRMVANLAENAARHAMSRVVFELGEIEEGVVLSVADDGQGIAPAEHERVFERFARADESRSRDDGGSGLGLSIVSDVVTRHGGTVSIDPEHEPGARFVIVLPPSVA